MIKFTSLIVALGLSLSSPSFAKPQSSKDLAEQYGKLFSNIDHLQVDFTQITYKKLRDRRHTRTGKAYFSKPAKFRWNFEDQKAGLEEFYFDGDTLTHFKEKEKLVTHYKANVGLARELREVVNLVLDPQALFDRYHVTSSETKGSLTSIELSPRSAVATDIQVLKVTVSDQTRSVQQVKILYMDENYTEFTFKNPIAKPNDPKLFRFSRNGSFTIRTHG
ncbi:MAG: LolA family protein [Oligoflexus sp.]